MDAAETDRTADVERVRQTAVHGPAPPVRVHDQGSPLERLASGIGNRRLERVVARMRDGEGIMPGGIVHPDVEAAIAVARGGGRALDGTLSQRMEPTYGDALANVRVHSGDGATALARAVSARAFTVGNDIFFGPGEYRPGTPGGDRLIAHEVAHVVQQRGAPMHGPLTVSQPGDALEREAEGAARDLGT